MKKGIVAYFFCMFLFLGIYLSILQRVIGEIAVYYSLDNTAMGTLIMMTFIGYFLSPILTGEISDRFGRRTVMLSAFIAMLAGYTLVITINTPVGAGAGFLLAGMAFGVLEVTMSSALTDLRPQSAQRIMNNSRLFLALGTIAGPFLAIGLITLSLSWHSVIVFLLSLLAVLFIIFLLLSYPKARYADSSIKEHGKKPLTLKLLKNRTLLLLCISVMMYVAVETGLAFYVSRYIGQINSNQFFSSLTLSVFWLCMAIGRLLSGGYKKDLHTLVGGLSIIACVGLIVSMLTDNLAISIVAFGVMGFGCSGMFPTLLALAKNNFPNTTGTVFGIMLSSAALGGIVQPIIMGAIADGQGLKIALATCLVPLLVIILMQFLLSTKKQANVADSGFVG